MNVGVAKKAEAAPISPSPVQDALVDPLADPLAASAAPTKTPRAKGGTEKGKAEYQALLGSALGDKVYAAVAPHLTQAAMTQVARQAVDGGLKGLGGLLGKLDESADPAAVQAFSNALAAQFGPSANTYMASDSGKKLAESMADWVDTNPEWVVAIGLLAAAGAVVANMEIPEIKQKIGLADGTDAEIAAKLGSLRDIALKEIKATIKHQSDNLKATLGVKNDKDGTTVDASARVGGEERWVEGSAAIDGGGLKVWGVKGLERTGVGDVEGGIKGERGKKPAVHASLTRKDGKTTTTRGVEYDASNAVLTFRDRAAFDDGANQVEATRSSSSDGSKAAGVALNQQHDANLSTSLAAEARTDSAGGQSGAVKGGMAYSKDKLKANLNAEYAFGAQNTSYKAGADLQYADGQNKAMLGYQYDAAKDQHDISALGQVGLDERTAVRGTVNHTTGAAGTKTEVGGHVARKLDLKDLSVFGGGTVELQGGRNKFIPEVGVQVKGVPIKVGFDPADKSFRLGITVPF